jgi:hemerythrin-like metal-binding protein
MTENPLRLNTQEFDRNWARWIMETAYRWEDLKDVIKLTGIDIVDADHRVLIEYAIEFNRLFKLVDDGGFDINFIRALQELFRHLYDFTKEHFDREQKLIKRMGILGIEEQCQKHKLILNQLISYQHEIESGRLNIAFQFKSTFMEWLVNHINLIDYETFRLDNIGLIVLAKTYHWNDASFLIRSMSFDKIDTDHREMTEYVLELNALIDNEQNAPAADIRQRAMPILHKLDDFAHEHVEREEAIIKRYELKNLSKQEKEHNELFSLLKSCIEDPNKPLLQIKLDILEWWVKHINMTDYSSFKADNWTYQVLNHADKVEDVVDLITSMGVKSVDDQHQLQTKHIFELNTQLKVYEQDGASPSVMKEILDKTSKIYRFAETHFTHEEHIMERINAPFLSNHRMEHQALLTKIQTYINNVRSGRIQLSTKLKTLFAEWWIHHINHTDYNSFRTYRQ